MSGAGAAAAIFVWVTASWVDASASGLPQFAQNFASAATLASQRGHVRGGESTLIGLASYSSSFAALSLDQSEQVFYNEVCPNRAISGRQTSAITPRIERKR